MDPKQTPSLSFPQPAGPARVLLTTAPAGVAHDLARSLVEERLAACVNLVPGVRSVYRWEGAVHDDPETLLVVKTQVGRLEGLARRIGELHPYEVPELLVLAPEGGSDAYLRWLRGAVESEA